MLQVPSYVGCLLPERARVCEPHEPEGGAEGCAVLTWLIMHVSSSSLEKPV